MFRLLNAVRDALIDGLLSNNIRLRLLENNTLTLDDASNQARSLEQAQLHSNSYTDHSSYTAAVNSIDETASDKGCLWSTEEGSIKSAAIFKPSFKKCLYCGNYMHQRSKCPARLAFCHNCGKRDILVKFASVKKILLIQGCLLLLWIIDRLLVPSLIIPKMGYQKLPK